MRYDYISRITGSDLLVINATAKRAALGLIYGSRKVLFDRKYLYFSDYDNIWACISTHKGFLNVSTKQQLFAVGSP